MEKLKEALIAHYQKEGLPDNEAKATAEQMTKVPTSVSTNAELSDYTKIRNVPWSDLKHRAMKDSFTKKIFDGYKEEDQKMLKKLIEAQRKQGDMLALRLSGEDFKK